MKLINLTPHVLNIFSEEGSPLLDVPPSGDVARCVESFVSLDPIIVDGVSLPLISGSFGEVEGLPAPQPETIYIVSGLVLSALGDSRGDVVAPGPLKRGPDGKPIGCVGLRR